MGSKVMSMADQGRIDQFRELITVGAEAKEVRQALTRLYMQHSRMLLVLPEGAMHLNPAETAEDMYFLSQLIMLLDEPE